MSPERAAAIANHLAEGSGGWRRAYVALDPGVHTFESTASFGLTTYAYGNAVSYGTIGGLDISTVEEE